MTGKQILAAFESIGAVVRLTPAGIVDVDAPVVPELDRLVAEVKANRQEVVEELKRHTVLPFIPDRRERTKARLAGVPCSVHGVTVWTVNDRGDAWCSLCFPSGTTATPEQSNAGAGETVADDPEQDPEHDPPVRGGD